MPVRIEAGEDFRQELQLHQGRIFGTGLEGMLDIGTDHHHLVLAEADTLVLQMQDAIALLHIVDLNTQMLMRPECLERAERHKAKPSRLCFRFSVMPSSIPHNDCSDGCSIRLCI